MERGERTWIRSGSFVWEEKHPNHRYMFSVIQGRVMVVDIKKAGFQCCVVNIYAHAESRARRELFAGLDICLMTSNVIIAGGDLTL